LFVLFEGLLKINLLMDYDLYMGYSPRYMYLILKYNKCFLLVRYRAVESLCVLTFRWDVSLPSSGSKISRTRNQLAAGGHWFLAWLIFDPGDGCDTFLRNVVHIRTTQRYIPEDGNVTIAVINSNPAYKRIILGTHSMRYWVTSNILSGHSKIPGTL
jgi:hypothetical protein